MFWLVLQLKFTYYVYVTCGYDNLCVKTLRNSRASVIFDEILRLPSSVHNVARSEVSSSSFFFNILKFHVVVCKIPNVLALKLTCSTFTRSIVCLASDIMYITVFSRRLSLRRDMNNRVDLFNSLIVEYLLFTCLFYTCLQRNVRDWSSNLTSQLLLGTSQDNEITYDMNCVLFWRLSVLLSFSRIYPDGNILLKFSTNWSHFS